MWNVYPGSQRLYKRIVFRGTDFGNFLYFSRSKYSPWNSRVYTELVEYHHWRDPHLFINHVAVGQTCDSTWLASIGSEPSPSIWMAPVRRPSEVSLRF